MILVDTHALIWWQQDPSPLPSRVADRIANAKRIYVSAVTCWEIATLVAKGRLELDRTLRQWLADMRADRRIHLHPLSPEAAIVAADLDITGFHADPADRLLYASALGLGAALLTRDARIHTYAQGAPARLFVDCVWGDTR